MARLNDLTGQRFGLLTVVARVQDAKPVRWHCKCADANRLRIAGWRKEAICEELGINPRTYASYMPYTKGSYLIDSNRKTVNAQRIAACRRRKAEAEAADHE